MLKWIYGEPQEKSNRWRRYEVQQEAAEPPSNTENLLCEDNVCLKTINKQACTEIVRPKDKENLYTKVSEREPLIQIGVNPFHQNSYIKDIEIQDRFLRAR